MRESELRDQLAANLEILEEGLGLGEVEDRLVSKDGSIGRVDIRARDRHGNIVVIEVKRSNKSAREAAHQVFKYAEILCREQGHPAERIRVMVASTEWNELDLSFSGYAGLTEFDLRGYRLLLDQAGTMLVGAELVKLKDPARPVEPSDSHVTFVFDNEDDRKEAWEKVQDRAQAYGVENLLGFDFITDIDAPTLGTHLLYLVIGSIDLDDPRTARIATEPTDDDIEYRDREHFLQQRVIAHLLPDITKPFGWDLSNPRTLNDMLSGRGVWRFEEHVCCSGAFALQDHQLEVEDWVVAVTVKSGFHQQMFRGSGTPSNQGAWEALKRKVSMSLGTNPDWRALTASVLERIEGEYPNHDVDIVILNPTDLVGVLVASWPDQVKQFEPQLQIRITSRGGRVHDIHGVLKGTPGRIDFWTRFRQVYRTPDTWFAVRAADEVETVDLALLHALGLEYILMEQVPDPQPHVRIHSMDGDRVATRTTPLSPRTDLHLLDIAPLADFLETHRDQVDYLVSEYRQRLGLDLLQPPVFDYP